MKISDRFKGCIMGGAIGDAYGSCHENVLPIQNLKETYFLYGKPESEDMIWGITDDTQLTIATCEAITENESLDAEIFAKKYLEFYKSRKLTGLGSSTLKAMQELEVGGHWSQVGRKGEYAAGNGSAMRVAPLAFETKVSRDFIRNFSIITHHNDEAYVGALSVFLAIQAIIEGTWTGLENLLEIIIEQIPDTRVRDRLITINKLNCDVIEVGKLGSDGYVVNSIPLAIAYASMVPKLGLHNMYKQIISLGGDTDTNCSIAGQIAGAFIGYNNIPSELLYNLKELKEYIWIDKTIEAYLSNRNWS